VPPTELVILGAGPAYTDRLGATGAAYLVRRRDAAVLLDLGQGSFPRLVTTVDPARLAGVVVSHLHPDHFIDLVPLRHYLVWERRSRHRVRVVAPVGLAERLDGLHAEPGFTARGLDVEDLRPGSLDLRPFVIEARRITHTDDSYAVRIDLDDGRGLVYSGDCGRAEDLDPLIRPRDTLLVEVSFGPGPVDPGAKHLDGPAVGALAARTRPGRILLTHIQMGFDAAATLASVRSLYDGEVRFVDPGDVILL